MSDMTLWTKPIRPQSMKIYYDGALGSEGALLSQPSEGSSSYGLQLLTKNELSEMIIRSWEIEMDVAIHTIGDQAAHDVAQVAHQLWELGKQGRLHLEHAQISWEQCRRQGPANGCENTFTLFS